METSLLIAAVISLHSKDYAAFMGIAGTALGILAPSPLPQKTKGLSETNGNNIVSGDQVQVGVDLGESK